MAADPQFKGKTILITGGTGSLGTAIVTRLLRDHDPASIRLFSRDELKQYESHERFGGDSRLRFFLGDVRSLDRLTQAMRGCDVVIHAAALKQVPACEYNPFEAVQTNIVGAENVVSAAIDAGVPRVLSVSTDKAVNPVNLYGATKLCAEKIVSQGNAYAADSPARFATARYGNVVGSRGSVVPLFRRQSIEGEITITDESMTRFWITLDEAVDFVIQCVGRMQGGEIFVPKLPSMNVVALADALAPDVPRRIVGVRPGEKLHEVLITEDESRHATEFDDHFAIYPSFPFWDVDFEKGTELPPGFRYTSDLNDKWLTAEEIREMADFVVTS